MCTRDVGTTRGSSRGVYHLKVFKTKVFELKVFEANDIQRSKVLGSLSKGIKWLLPISDVMGLIGFNIHSKIQINYVSAVGGVYSEKG